MNLSFLWYKNDSIPRNACVALRNIAMRDYQESVTTGQTDRKERLDENCSLYLYRAYMCKAKRDWRTDACIHSLTTRTAAFLCTLQHCCNGIRSILRVFPKQYMSSIGCRTEFWPHWVFIQRAVLKFIYTPCLKDLPGHLVIGSSVRLFVIPHTSLLILLRVDIGLQSPPSPAMDGSSFWIRHLQYNAILKIQQSLSEFIRQTVPLISFFFFSGSPRHCTIGKEDLSRTLPQSALRA